MKKFLLATTFLAATTGLAAAEISMSGDARMGIVSRYSVDAGENQLGFSSRARLKFTLSGETDGGLSFGATFRADQAAGSSKGIEGEAYLSGAFGKITMGDNDSAANVVIGHVDGVGYTGNGDFNEIRYVGQTDTSVLYTYVQGATTIAASIGQIDAERDYDDNAAQAYALAASYSFGTYKVMAGYEKGQTVVYSFRNIDDAYDPDPENTYWDRFDVDSHVVLGADATFGAISVKARAGIGGGLSYGEYPVDGTQYALSATYVADALALTAFVAGSDLAYEWIDGEDYGFKTLRLGIGATYDLGGGAAVSAGYTRVKSGLINYGGIEDWTDDRFETGVKFSF